MKKIIEFIKKNPIAASVLMSLALGFVFVLLFAASYPHHGDANTFKIMGLLQSMEGFFVWVIAVGAFLIYPFILSFINLASLFMAYPSDRAKKVIRKFGIITLVLGPLYSAAYIWFRGIISGDTWDINSAYLLALFPANCIIIAIRTIRYKILEWNTKPKQH